MPAMLASAAHAVVLGVDVALVVDHRHDLAEMPGSAPSHHPLVAAHGKFVHLLAVDAEFPRQVLGRLAHQQAEHRVGQAFHQADHRSQQRPGAASGNDRAFWPIRLHRHHGRRTSAPSSSE
jgi:hypothetical protein